jgi:hypothetical protein
VAHFEPVPAEGRSPGRLTSLLRPVAIVGLGSDLDPGAQRRGRHPCRSRSSPAETTDAMRLNPIREKRNGGGVSAYTKPRRKGVGLRTS